MRWAGIVTIIVTAGGALLGPAPDPGCAGQATPPPPPAAEELLGPAPAPLPWPPDPVGGAQLAACGDVGPAGGPAVGAASYVLADLDTGAVFAARAPHARHRPASTLKVLTAMVAIARLDPATVVDGVAEDLYVDGSKAGIGPGGKYTVEQLLDALLLNSGNDTAAALARALGGDAVTVAAMAARARELGAFDTRPATPSGLDGPGMASSAYDLALLYRVAMREPRFAATIATESIPFPGYGDKPGFTLFNSSRMLRLYPGSLGSKSGFTDAARHTFVGAAERGGRRLLVALMRGEQEPVQMWQQAAALLDWGFALPAGTPAIGTLVDTAPVPPTPTPVPVATAPPPGAAPAVTPASTTAAVLAGVAAGVAAAGLAVAAWLRRRRPASRGDQHRESG